MSAKTPTLTDAQIDELYAAVESSTTNSDFWRVCRIVCAQAKDGARYRALEEVEGMPARAKLCNCSMDECVFDEDYEKLRIFAIAQSAKLTSAQAELAEARRDADRYRWLRAQSTVPYPSDLYPGKIQHLIVFWNGGKELDAAIDSAIAATKGE